MSGQLAPPFVGPSYTRGGLVILSDALRGQGYDFSGATGLRSAGRSAHASFSSGAGASAWSEAASLAAVWLEVQGAKLQRDGDLYSFAALATALEHVAVVSSVKCAPPRAGHPMNFNCARHVLFPELGVLQPNRILLLSGRDTARVVRRMMPARLGASDHTSVRNGRRRSKLVIERRWHPELAKIDLLAVSRGKLRSTVPAARTLLTRWSTERRVR